MTINPTAPGIDLDGLEKVAREATPKPWFAYDLREMTNEVWIGTEKFHTHAATRRGSDDVEDKRLEDAAHIAAFDPPTALALIALARSAQPPAPRAEAENGAVKRLRLDAELFSETECNAIGTYNDSDGNVRYLGDTARDLRHVLAKLEELTQKSVQERARTAILAVKFNAKAEAARVHAEALSATVARAQAAEFQTQEFERARDSALAEWQREMAARQAAEARLAEAAKVLEPFAEAAAYYGSQYPDDAKVIAGFDFTPGHFRRAAELRASMTGGTQ